MGKRTSGLDRSVDPALRGVMGGYRWSALTLWVGGLLAVFVRLLFLASHGPTGYDERNEVLGLTHALSRHIHPHITAVVSGGECNTCW